MEKDNRHSALGKTRYQLLKVNKDHPIVFNDLYIASFNEIMNWKKTDYKYISYEKRPIDLNNPTEIALLERLIKAELFHQTMKDYVDDHGVLRAKNPKKVIGNKVMIFEAFYFDIQMTTSGEIYIGFDLKHRFEFRETLEEILLHNQYNLKKGEKVTDYINKRTYEYTFEEIASYTAGGKSDLNTQFVGFDESLMKEVRQKKMFKLHNILLGIYAKSGVQPWVLGDQLFSDCFIGLDVSHIDGKHSSGIVQVIGKDGRLIRQTTTSTHEPGEKISIDSLKDVVLDSIHAYQKVYQLYPKHITFHRDGLCREDLDSLEKLLSDLHIAFDYVEIIKSSNRRMAIYETSKGWYTKQGLYYTRDRTAYLCATNPHKSIGMAMPIKIIQKTSHLPFHQIIEDVYHLSFMHIHSLQKTRLPITTHYADISSYFHNKGLIHPRTKHTESLPFV